ncbi:DUF6035 family protein [Desulfopila aestuarii]|uniref:DUF6035 domain-containing protein n=1 Tax=Desulfopila aestuarii DSM 18488 TaxID=1121416 RepID=A0A1M7YFK2_9BACT|nr:DUF6035 family protein [Desulfopila aestuarii]SHO51400.1 hypothetical protein SAMN02745220_03986 [Desulfopila aestuarii DSM 18488]
MSLVESKLERLTVKSVLDRRRPSGLQLVDAELWLNSLSEVGYSELRASTAQQNNEASKIVCAECEWPVYSPDVGGRRRFFQHRKGFPRTCFYSGDEGRDPRQIDAEKFGGIQEGPRHKELKDLLCEILSFSKTAEGIIQERHISLDDGTFARPDVYVENWLGTPLAFDIQLSTTQIPNIIRREAFYKRGGIRYMWITDVEQTQLLRRAFRDIYMRNDGQIFGVDEEVLQEARKNRASFFRIFRLIPGEPQKGFQPEFRNKIIPADKIDWGKPGSLPRSKNRSYDKLVEWRGDENETIKKMRSSFFSALAEGNGQEAGALWNKTQSYVGGMLWEQLPGDSWDAEKSLGVLATVSTGKLCVNTRIGKDNEASIVNSILLEPKSRWPFAELLKQVLQSKRRSDLLERQSVSEKLERAIAGTMDIALAKNIGPVYDAFIPQGAFCRLMLSNVE